MQVSVRDQGRHRVISLAGEIDLYASVRVRGHILENLDEMPGSTPSLVLDLESLSYVDSSGIALMTDLRNIMADRGGEFALLRPFNRVQAVIKQSALDTLFTIYDSPAELDGPKKASPHYSRK